MILINNISNSKGSENENIQGQIKTNGRIWNPNCVIPYWVCGWVGGRCGSCCLLVSVLDV
jgi:hypothetical protein